MRTMQHASRYQDMKTSDSKSPANLSPPARRTIRRVDELLIQEYGKRTPLVRDPLDGLILIILSQATNDLNSDRAFRILQERFRSWEAVLNAPVDAVADAIRCGGLANQKAARIQQLLREIEAERGDLDLSWLHKATTPECVSYLSKFHGVGPKTIACVLMFFLGKPAFAVDTHVLRVTKRLGWLRPQASVDEAHRIFETAVPDECKLDLHVNLIAHGRAICRATGNGGPQCGICVLRRHCAYGKSMKGAQQESAKGTERRAGSDFFLTVQPTTKQAAAD
jgi:endonuclease-3